MANTYPIFLPNKGQALNAPEEFLADQFSPYSRNLQFTRELLEGRAGLTKFDSEQLPDRVMRAEQFWQFTGTWYLLVCTVRDIFSYDFGNTRFDVLTPIYNTGTITIDAGTLDTVTGSGTSWESNLKAGDFIKIGADELHTGSTWYEIDSVDSDTQLTLTSNAVETTAGTAYEARQTFSGGNNDYWDTVTFQDNTLGTTWIATNGVDTPIRWNASGQVTALTGLATGFTTAKYVNTYKDRLIWLWCVEGGQNEPQRERYSDVANCQSYDDLNFKDFVDEDSWITGTSKIGGYHIIHKEDCHYVQRWVGGTYIFDDEKSTTAEGTKSRRSIIETKDWVYYYGADQRFHRWNLLRDEVISETIYVDTQQFDPNQEQYIVGSKITALGQLRWHCPFVNENYNDYTVVYDLNSEFLQVWEYQSEQAMCCIGEYLNTADLYVDDPIWGEYYLDENEGYWDDRTFLDNAPIVIYGGYDGYIRNADQGQTDDGETYDRIYRSNRINFKKPDYIKRLWKQQFWFEAGVDGSVTIRLRKGDKTSWEPSSKTISLVSTTQDIIKENVTWDKHAQNFQVQIEAKNYFAMLGFINFYFVGEQVA